MRKIIKCSQCNKTFYNGTDYRKHFIETHLKDYENMLSSNK